MKLNNKLIRALLCAVLVSCIAAIGTAVAGDDVKNVTGTIDQTDAGFIIKAEDTNYSIITRSDLSTMVGKKVTVTGTVSEIGDNKTIHMMTIEEVQEKPHQPEKK